MIYNSIENRSLNIILDTMNYGLTSLHGFQFELESLMKSPLMRLSTPWMLLSRTCFRRGGAMCARVKLCEGPLRTSLPPQ